MRNQNVRLAQGKKCLGSFTLQIANYSLGDVLNIECAFPQIWVIDFAQGLSVTRGDFLERPLHIAKIGLKFSQNFIDQRAILDHEQVRIENRCVFRANGFGNPLLHLKDLHPRLDEPGLEPPDFIRNLRWRNLVTHHFINVLADDMNSAEGDSR